MSDNEFDDEAAAIAPLGPKVEVKRIFINHIDTYNGKNLAKFLSKCVVGASNDAGEEEAAFDEEASTIPNKKANTYNIYGTLKNKTEEFKKPDNIKEVIKVRFSLYF